MPNTISGSGISRLLTKAGFERCRKVSGGRAGVLSPLYPGFRIWDKGDSVLVDYLPSDADERMAQIEAMAKVLDAAGYGITEYSQRGDLRVRPVAEVDG